MEQGLRWRGEAKFCGGLSLLILRTAICRTRGRGVAGEETWGWLELSKCAACMLSKEGSSELWKQGAEVKRRETTKISRFHFWRVLASQDETSWRSIRISNISCCIILASRRPGHWWTAWLYHSMEDFHLPELDWNVCLTNMWFYGWLSLSNSKDSEVYDSSSRFKVCVKNWQRLKTTSPPKVEG